jgi:flagellar biosynthesis protein FlhF
MSDCHQALAVALDEEMIFGEPVEQSRTRAIALVGPTGVGKTTTIAKIAAQLALVDQRRIGLVSIDQYRIGATEQLECFANLIGCPMHIAHDAASLEIALRKLSEADLVLIDTAGRSPKDRVALANMAECLYGVQEPVEVQLCLPASTRDSELQVAIDRHSILRPTKLISTKLDEALYHGAIIAAQVLSGLPLTYFTTGQCVPEDIERASSARLADLLCGEEI